MNNSQIATAKSAASIATVAASTATATASFENRALRSGSVPTNRSIRRRWLMTILIGGSLGMSSMGCASRPISFASMNPFKSKSGDPIITETPATVASTTGKVASGGVTATRNVFQKTSSKITGMFGKDKDASNPDDPLSLSNQPDKLEPDVFVANGQLWESTGNLTKAMESYAKALETSPNHAPALTSIARLHFREKNYPKSAEFFQKAIAQDPEDAALYNDLGLTLSQLGQHAMAGQTLQRALQLAPGTSRYANNLASVHFESGQPDLALAVLQQNNKPAVAHFNMAFLYYKKGQTAEAQTQLQQSLAFENQSAGDPATKRAIDRSREMLAQINPAGLPINATASPTSLASGSPREVGPAAGPAAVIAAAPSHRADSPSQSFGVPNFGAPGAAQQVIGPMGPPTRQPAATGSTPVVNYHDPSSYMSPQIPAGMTPPSLAPKQLPTTAPINGTPTAPNGTSPNAKPAPGTSPAAQPPATGFAFPSGMQLPSE